MSTPSEREAALRRALLSAAEQIEPAPGGLERIQARLGRPRPLPVAWFEAAWTVLVMRVPDIIEAIRRPAAKGLRLVWQRFGPGSTVGAGPQRLSWLRPLAAMSVAVFVLGAGAYVALDSISASIFQAGSNSLGGQGGNGSHSGGPGQPGRSTALSNGSRPGYLGGPNPSASSTACAKTPVPFHSGQEPSTGASIQPPTPTPSPSDTNTGSPSPTPTDTTSPTPGGSTPPSGGNSVATPGAGLLGGNGAPAGATALNGTGNNASPAQSTSPSEAAGAKRTPAGKTVSNPCSSPKPKHKGHRTAGVNARPAAASAGRLTSAERTSTRPGGQGAAKLD